MLDQPIAPGQVAPEFNLPSTGPTPTQSLAELRGKIVTLFFYPLDFTDT